MVEHLESLGFVSPRQHGFRVRRSTVTSLLQTQVEWKRMLTVCSDFYAVYLDFSKAFDVVDHNILRLKLRKSGIGGAALDWLGDYLKRRTMSVILEDVGSSRKMIHSGVIQGSAIGPALFSFLAHDIPSKVGELATTSLFADDVKLHARELVSAELATQEVVNWSIDNRLPLAPDKTLLMKVRRRRASDHSEHITVSGVEIKTTNEVCDLGIQVRDDLECESHVNRTMVKSFRVSNLVLRVLKTKDIKIFRTAFYSLVLPTLEYGSVVWSPYYAKDVNKIEAVQRRFTKRAQNKCGIRYECYADRLRRWGIPTLETRRMISDLTWVYKIVYGYVDLDRAEFFRIVQSHVEIKIFPLTIVSNARNNTQMNTLAQRAYKTWNSLPVKVRNSVSVQSFKSSLKKLEIGNIIISKIK
jgi:hypothetical protein